METVEGAKGALTVIGAMGEEMGPSMLPGLGQMLGMDAEGVGQMLAQNFPATAQALQTFPQSMERFNVLVQTFDDNLDNYATLKPVEFTPIIAIFIVGGILIAAAGLPGFIWRKEEE